MKILVFYTPRSKSTMVHDVLQRHYGLDNIGDSLTLSRIANQGFLEYNKIIDTINNTDNICVKMNPNDFIDIPNQCINYRYKNIDYASFDKIVTITRDNYVDAVLSYAYMNPQDQASWHRRRGAEKVGVRYEIPEFKVFYLLRGYCLFHKIKAHIEQTAGADRMHHYEYQTVEQDLARDFGLNAADFDIDLVPNGLDYSQLATNYDEIVELTKQVYQRMTALPVDELDNWRSFFWNDRSR